MKRTLCLLLLLALTLALAACGQPRLVTMPDPAQSAAPAPEGESARTGGDEPALTPQPTPEPTPEPTPQPPARQLDIRLSDRDREANLLDEYHRSYSTFRPRAELRVYADEPIGNLYLVWNTHTVPYEILAGGERVACGQNGWLHEYVELPVPATELTIVMPDQEMDLCDILAFTEGSPHEKAQVWEPPCEQADVLVFPTHSDDEFLFFGGIIPIYGRELGYQVQVVYFTNHYVGAERYRCHELLNGLWAAGVTHYPIPGPFRDWIADSLEVARDRYGWDNSVAYQVELIRRFKPLVIVEHAENGEYGHGVHMLNAYAMEQAVYDAADPAKFPESAEKYGVWDTPKLYLHLYGDDPTILNYEYPLESFGGMTGFEMAKLCYTYQLSQQHWNFHVYDYGSDYDCHRFGLFRSLVGEDVEKNDLMEHIDLAAYGR